MCDCEDFKEQEVFPYVIGEEIEMIYNDKWVRGKVVEGHGYKNGIITIELPDGEQIWCDENAEGSYRQVEKEEIDELDYPCFRYSVKTAYKNNVYEHPQTIMANLGFRVRNNQPIPLENAWVFETEYIGDDEDLDLPPYIERIKSGYFNVERVDVGDEGELPWYD